MSPWHAAHVGDPVSSIDTPALVLELNAFERNLKRMADALALRGIRLRAHAKSHKCPEIARRQVAMGAVGVCCQKVSEAAVFVAAGLQDVLITNQLMSAAKVARLFDLATQARMGVLIDHPQQLALLRAQAAQSQVSLDVYVEVNVGANRCGAEPGEACVQLARDIVASPFLRFAGLHCYHGGAQHMRLPDERRQAIAQAGAQSVQEVRAAPALVCFTARMREQSRELKRFLFANLYRHPQVMQTTDQARQVVRDLFAAYLNSPQEMQADFARRDDTPQAVADYIAGMTDRFAAREHARLTGQQVLT